MGFGATWMTCQVSFGFEIKLIIMIITGHSGVCENSAKRKHERREVTLDRLTNTSIWGCPNTLESGSEKPLDFVMYCLLRKFIV
jgi:hypothetical protein